MTRGIHLKQLSKTDLGLLGLPEDPSEDGESPPIPEDSPTAVATRGIGPPPNLKAPPQTDQAAGTGPGWNHPEIDLAALTREIRIGLEDTLRFLEGNCPEPDGPPQVD